MLKKLILYLALVLLSFFAFKPLLAPGFFPIHDDTQIARVFEMTKGLKDGMFPVRWVMDLGYGFGYPIFNFYDPFFYYVGGIFGLIGINALDSTKLVLLLSVTFSGISMFLFSRQLWGNLGGILSSMLYVYAPYHAVDLYVRGDFAESLAYAFIPLIFYGLWKIYKEYKWKYVIISSISFALVIISHNLTAIMISPFLFMFSFYLSFRNRKRYMYLFLSLFIGILVSAFYSVPTLLEMNYTNIISQIGGGADFRNHFVCPEQLWSSPWGYGGSAKGCIDGLSFMIGKYHIVLSLFAVLASIFLLAKNKYKESKEKFHLIILFFAGYLIAVFLTLEISKPVWEVIKTMSFFQYPWRFLILIVFFSSVISGSVFFLIEKTIKNKRWIALFVALLISMIIASNSKFFKAQTVLDKNSRDYTNSYSLKWTTSKISDEYMPKNFKKPQNYSQVSNINNLNSQSLTVLDFSQKTGELLIDFMASKNMSITVPLAYFPAWQAFLDGNKVQSAENSMGILIALPRGIHTLKFQFKQTPVETVADLISVASILLLFGYNALKKHE